MNVKSGNQRNEGHSKGNGAGAINQVKKQKHEGSHKVKARHLKKEAVNKRTKLDHEHENHVGKKNHDGRAARVHPNKRKPLKHKEHAVTPA
jgi:hypothetical protein